MVYLWVEMGGEESMNEIEREGYNARMDEFEENPYCYGTQDFKDWQRGWVQADNELEYGDDYDFEDEEGD